MNHKFEIFTAGCELCKQAIETVRDNTCENCEIVEYDLQSPIKDEIKEKLEKYNVMVVPTIIIDEKHKYTGNLNPDDIKKIIADD
jgi:protein-disulfide isomerase